MATLIRPRIMHNAASDLGLHCLPVTRFMVSRPKWVSWESSYMVSFQSFVIFWKFRILLSAARTIFRVFSCLMDCGYTCSCLILSCTVVTFFGKERFFFFVVDVFVCYMDTFRHSLLPFPLRVTGTCIICECDNYWISPWLYFKFLHTIMTLNIGTDMPEQTVKIQIRRRRTRRLIRVYTACHSSSSN